MKTKKSLKKVLVLLVVGALVLAGCDRLATEESPTPEAIEREETSETVISATGVVIPQTWATLGATASGNIAELYVAEGDVVEAGAVLLVLDGAEGLEADRTAAAYWVTAAQQVLDDLYEDAGLAAAEARENVVQAEQQVLEAERLVDDYKETQWKDDLDWARDEVIDAEDKLDSAKEDFEPYEDYDEENETRKRYEDALDDSQIAYDDAVRKVRLMELEIEAAEATLQAARARLESAQNNLAALANGPDADDLALAQADLDQAQASLAASEAALADLQVVAPFAGTVGKLYVRVGEWVNIGEAVLILGDLTTLVVETTDLNEIDAARLALGDAASVTFDALPDVVVSGEVVYIAPRASEGSGVNYKVVVEFAEMPEGLLWGMTAFVDVEVE
ncbi:MAG: efflux RND transporter periplasmic adaptor subunit [Anaerolineales bacterium]|nr:efflux RND transporter periplasmic adaptor subunit [Anaerolineales bacterium]